MEKLTEYINKIRINKSTKDGLIEMSEKEDRKLNNLVRIILENAVKKFRNKN